MINLIAKFFSYKYSSIVILTILLVAYGAKYLVNTRSYNITNEQIKEILATPVIDKYLLTNQSSDNLSYLNLNDDLDYKRYKNIIEKVNCDYENLIDKNIKNQDDRLLVAINCIHFLGAQIGNEYWALQGTNILELNNYNNEELKDINNFTLVNIKRASFYKEKSINQLISLRQYCKNGIDNIKLGNRLDFTYNFQLAQKVILIESCLILQTLTKNLN